jgi:hypothetical protein
LIVGGFHTTSDYPRYADVSTTALAPGYALARTLPERPIQGRKTPYVKGAVSDDDG